MAIDLDLLFERLGKGFAIQKAMNTARGATVPPLVKSFLDEFDSESLPLRQATSPATAANRSFQDSATNSVQQLRTVLENVIIQTVEEDNPQDQRSIVVALRELIRQMDQQSETVAKATVTASVTPEPHNHGNGAVLVSLIRPDGRTQENALAEHLQMEVTSDALSAGVVVKGSIAETDRLSHNWPKGSGVQISTSAVDASTSLLTNGTFDAESLEVPSLPANWNFSVATPGTTVRLTNYQVQQIVITGTPASGFYRISLGLAGKVQITAPIVYNASGGMVQTAIRALEGFSEVAVASTGTTPNETHLITFNGIVASDLAQLTVLNSTDTGSFAVTTPAAGSIHAFKGRALELDSNGTELTTLQQRMLALRPLQAYGVNLWAMADVVPAAGEVTIDLVDGIGGAVIDDEQGTPNSFSIDCTDLTTSFTPHNHAFRLPRVLPATIFLRIRISTAISSGSSVFLDHCSLSQLDEVYPGGPLLKVFTGSVPFRTGGNQVRPDGWTLSIANDRGGEFQEWFSRNFDMDSRGLLLPSSDTETIPDSLIA